MSDISLEAGQNATPHSRPPSVRRKSMSSGGRVSVISATPNQSEKPEPTSLLLLHNVETIFDSLDNYQTSLQSLEGSHAAVSFHEDLHHWHKQLQTVEAVLRVWLDVQTMWVQLEEILSSQEVSQYLPTQHFNFSTINKEWRVLMSATAKNPNVLSTCLQEGTYCAIVALLTLMTHTPLHQPLTSTTTHYITSIAGYCGERLDLIEVGVVDWLL